jgi:hypothetical protein
LKKIRLLSFLVFLPALTILTCNAQEVLSPLTSNQVIEEFIQNKPTGTLQKKDTVIQNLPFFDDFINSGSYPDENKWVDEYTFRNDDFGKNPPSRGVITFDGLNNVGLAYKSGADVSVSQACDTLSSTYIDLSGLKNSDSVYLSFFYQPGGYGDHPERNDSRDSLILQFKADSFFNGTIWVKNGWVTVWTTRGSVLDLPFNQALLPIISTTQQNFFIDKFQFRFINYGNPSGNLDIWNLDYVYLNRGRNYRDTSYDDVAIYKPERSIDKRYFSLPWNIFSNKIASHLVDSVSIYATNNSDKIKNVTFGYDVINESDPTNPLAELFNTQGDNLNPRQHRSFGLPVSFNTFPGNRSELFLDILTTVSSIPDDHRSNDTSIRIQYFGNYLAYDDGTAEAGYGLTGTRNGKVAQEFIIDNPDTVYGIAVFFNQSLDYVGQQNFNLAIWDELTQGATENDKPKATLNYLRPIYQKWHNHFIYFRFDEPVPVGKKFYIGWTQNSDFNLNIGMDMNYSDVITSEENPNLYFSAAGSWQKSKLKGALMIRPVLNDNEYQASVENLDDDSKVTIFPNPTSGSFGIKFPAFGIYDITISDLNGKELATEYVANRENVIFENSSLSSGVYLIRITRTEDGLFYFKKLIICR